MDTQVLTPILTWCSSWLQGNCPFSRAGDTWWWQIYRGVSYSQLESHIPSHLLLCKTSKYAYAVHLPSLEQRALPDLGSWWQGSSRGFTGFHAPPVILDKVQRGALWSITSYYTFCKIVLCDDLWPKGNWHSWTVRAVNRGNRCVPPAPGLTDSIKVQRYPHLLLPLLFYFR